jgi:hypothetical protein
LCELRERRGPRAMLAGGPGTPERRPVRLRVRDRDQHPVDRAHRHARHHDRRRRIIADQRPGRPPEQLLHQRRRHHEPPAGDDLRARDVPFPRERHLRDQPGHPPQRLAIPGIGHQRYRDHQPDHQRAGHDPLPLPRRHPPLSDRRRGQFLDHALAQVPLQLTQPHEIGQPPAGQHHPAPDHRRSGHHRMAERHQRPWLHRRPGQHRPPPAGRPPRPGPQVSGPERHHPRRLRRVCNISNRPI